MNSQQFFGFVIAFAVLFFSQCRGGVDAQGTNASFEQCTETSDCRPGLTCFFPGEFGLKPCLFSKPNNPCRCLTIAPRECSAKNNFCPPAEGCGTHKTFGSQFCVACNLLFDPTSNYAFIKGLPACEATPSPLATPSQSPGPPRRALDLCSAMSDVCDQGLDCLSYDGALCGDSGPPCICYPGKGEPGANCTKATDCSHPLETCLFYTSENSTSCGSCTRLKTDAFYVLAESDDATCDGVEPRNPPQYIPSSGLALDGCFSDRDCREPRKCSAGGEACNELAIFCECLGVDWNLVPCNKSSDCLQGELCGTILGIPPQICISLSKYYEAPRQYVVQGRLPARGNLTTYDVCVDDHQCGEGLYCTHLSEEGLGGCLGRRGCACVPPLPVQCESEDDCRTGESCVRVPDARQEAQCYSTEEFLKSPYYTDVSSNDNRTPVALPTGGWLTDLCKENSDCQQDKFERKCQHFAEEFGTCDGRDICICRRADGMEPVCESTNDCGAGETCAIVVDSKRTVNATCISTEVLRLEFFSLIYVEVNSGKRRPLSSPSMSATPSVSPSASASATNTPSLSPSPSTSPSGSVTPSLSPSLSTSPSATASVSTSASASLSGTVEPEGDDDSEITESGDPICIDVAALKDLDDSELVFPTARRAAVLCDENGSCATAGHMVVWNRRAMMMKTYCELHARCVRRIRYVNSPRMRRNLRIASNSHDLSFTSFAARFATRLEERFLVNVVHFGF